MGTAEARYILGGGRGSRHLLGAYPADGEACSRNLPPHDFWPLAVCASGSGFGWRFITSFRAGLSIYVRLRARVLAPTCKVGLCLKASGRHVLSHFRRRKSRSFPFRQREHRKPRRRRIVSGQQILQSHVLTPFRANGKISENTDTVLSCRGSSRPRSTIVRCVDKSRSHGVRAFVSVGF